MNISRETKIVLLIALFGAGIVFLCGVSSDVSKGDEPYHFRLASLIHETGSRPVYDTRHHFSPEGHRLLSTGMLWHGGLASIWWMTGRESAVSAQLYQAAWYFLLVIATYLLAKEIYSGEESLYSALLVATIPASSAYTILLYTDIPVTTLGLFCFLFLIRGRYLASGLFFCLMALTKRNSYLFAPAIMLWIVFSSVEIPTAKILTYEFLKDILKSVTSRKCLTSLSVFLFPAIIIILPDIYFRAQHLHLLTIPSTEIHHAIIDAKEKYIHPVFIHPSNFISHPTYVIRELGAAVLLGILLYLLNRRYQARDYFVGLLVISYTFSFLIAPFVYPVFSMLRVHHINYLWFLNILNTSFAIRYFIPIFPMLSILAAVGILSLTRRNLRSAVISLCILQLLVASAFIRDFRLISPDTRSAYAFINENALEGNILCPGTELLVHTSGSIMWDSDNTMPDLPRLFWVADEQEALKILKRYNITYIFLENNKIVDDSKFHNYGGFPRSFVENRLPAFKFLKLIFENPTTKIWKVDYPG